MFDIHTERSAQLTVGPHALLLLGVHKTFHAGIPGCTARVDVLRGIDLAVRCGEIVGIAGAVGTGKSTLLLCAAGLLKPNAGSVTAFGQLTPGNPPLVAYVSLAGELGARINGTQALGRALSTGAHVLLLDDLLTHLSPGACKLIGALASRGMTIIAAERDRTRLDALAERTLVLSEGALRTRAHPGRRPAAQRSKEGEEPRRAAVPARVAEPAVTRSSRCPA